TYGAAQFATLGLPGMTNYIPSCGTVGHWPDGTGTAGYYATHEGAFVEEISLNMASLSDGASNTFLFGEYLGAFANGDSGTRIRVMPLVAAGRFPSYLSIVTLRDT